MSFALAGRVKVRSSVARSDTLFAGGASGNAIIIGLSEQLSSVGNAIAMRNSIGFELSIFQPPLFHFGGCGNANIFIELAPSTRCAAASDQQPA